MNLFLLLIVKNYGNKEKLTLWFTEVFSIVSKLSPVSEANHPECDHAGHSLEHCSDLPLCLLPPLLSFTTEHDLSVISAPCKNIRKKKKLLSISLLTRPS